MQDSTNTIQAGARVKWEWGDRYAEGRVKKTYDRVVSMLIHGYELTVKGKANDKALLIQYADGSEVLRLESQVVPQDFGRH